MTKKKSISLLLGAGFSVPMGYPKGNELNEKISDIRGYEFGISPYGEVYKGKKNRNYPF